MVFNWHEARHLSVQKVGGFGVLQVLNTAARKKELFSFQCFFAVFHPEFKVEKQHSIRFHQNLKIEVQVEY